MDVVGIEVADIAADELAYPQIKNTLSTAEFSRGERSISKDVSSSDRGKRSVLGRMWAILRVDRLVRSLRS